MASIIACIAQTRVVEEHRVRFMCMTMYGDNPTLQMVKTTTGYGYVLNGRVLFSMDQVKEAARAFFLTIQFASDDEEPDRHDILFGQVREINGEKECPMEVVFSFSRQWSEGGVGDVCLQRFVDLLRNPPMFIE